MKITPKILSIPPYLSTSWSHIRTLYFAGGNLIVTLNDGTAIGIPNLSEQEISNIFAAHASFSDIAQHKGQIPPLVPFNLPTQLQSGEGLGALRFSFDNNMETLSSAMHHNAEQSNLPDLPVEILGKIASIAKIVAPNEIQNMPKPEPHCNCPHCQIARAIHGKEGSATTDPAQSIPELIDEEVSDKDLSFEQWVITQAGDNLFTVTNKLDTLEKYSVFLGEPVGCTCGKTGCEHILAVLKS